MERRAASNRRVVVELVQGQQVGGFEQSRSKLRGTADVQRSSSSANSAAYRANKVARPACESKARNIGAGCPSYGGQRTVRFDAMHFKKGLLALQRLCKLGAFKGGRPVVQLLGQQMNPEHLTYR